MEALDCWRGIGYRHGVAVALGNLAEAASTTGDRARARRLALESLRHARQIGFTEVRVNAIETLAGLIADEGRTTLAAELRSVVEHYRRTG